MEDEKDFELPENVDELMQIKKDLKKEEEFILKMITTINEQLHALEVERMHLSSAVIQSSTNEVSTNKSIDTKDLLTISVMKTENTQNQPKSQFDGESNLNADLNLNVSAVYEYYDEEEEEFDRSDEENLDDYM